MESNKMNKKGNIKAAMIGGLVGGVMGLILAPKSGQELRQDLFKQANKIGDKAIDIKTIAQCACQNVEDKTKETLNTGKDWIEKGKQTVSNLKILVHEIQTGALAKTDSIDSWKEENVSDPANDIRIIENEHED